MSCDNMSGNRLDDLQVLNRDLIFQNRLAHGDNFETSGFSFHIEDNKKGKKATLNGAESLR